MKNNQHPTANFQQPMVFDGNLDSTLGVRGWMPAVLRTVLPVFLITILMALTSGCAFLKPAKSESHYYVLTASHDASKLPAKTMAGCSIRLLPVEVANYLQTKSMAVRQATNQVTFSLFHRWAEPLDAGIRRALAEDLRAQPGIRAVLTDQTSPSHEPVYIISVRVLACEGSQTNRRGAIIFKAVWQISRSGPQEAVVAHGVFQAPPAVWHPGNYDQLASRLSQALGDFSRALVQAISQQTDGNPAP